MGDFQLISIQDISTERNSFSLQKIGLIQVKQPHGNWEHSQCSHITTEPKLPVSFINYISAQPSRSIDNNTRVRVLVGFCNPCLVYSSLEQFTSTMTER